MISKTPFSANISIKSSFIKYYMVPSFSEIEVKIEAEDFKLSEVDKLNNEFNCVNEQNLTLQANLKQEKIKVKSLEEQIGLFRQEILDLKKEKNVTKTKLKTQSSEIESMKSANNLIDVVVNDLKNQISKKDNELKTIDDVNKSLNKENGDLLNKIDGLNSELMKATSTSNTTAKHECLFCDSTFESGASLNEHIRHYHCKDQVSQTKNISCEVFIQTDELHELHEPLDCEYSCFYCGDGISTSPLQHLE